MKSRVAGVGWADAKVGGEEIGQAAGIGYSMGLADEDVAVLEEEDSRL